MNDDLPSGGGRMTDVAVNRLSVRGEGQSEDDAERGGAKNLD